MLSELQIRSAKCGPRPRKLADGGGLYLYITPSGGKRWRYDYRFSGKRQTIVLGAYPLIGLRDARNRHFEARRLLEAGENPATKNADLKRERVLASERTLGVVAQKWFHELRPHRSKSWSSLIGGFLRNHIVPALGSLPLDDVEPQMVLNLVQRIAARGTPHVAEGVRWTIARIYTHAVRTLLTKNNPARDLRGAIIKPRTKHHPSLTEGQLPALLGRLRNYGGRAETRLALELLLLTFVRKNELVRAKWAEFDLEAGIWRIPHERMKMREEHVVPLSRQALEVLFRLRDLADGSQFLFPGKSSRDRSISGETLNAALSTMGYAGILSPHGVRATASTILNERGWRPDVIERQLAHKEANKVRASYNRAAYLRERREMMQAWADLLDDARRSQVRDAPVSCVPHMASVE